MVILWRKVKASSHNLFKNTKTEYSHLKGDEKKKKKKEKKEKKCDRTEVYLEFFVYAIKRRPDENPVLRKGPEGQGRSHQSLGLSKGHCRQRL